MQKCLLTIAIFITLIPPELFSQLAPLDRCVRDSLFLVKPHESPVEKAKIYLELAELIRRDMPQKAFSYIASAFRISVYEKNDSLKARTRMMMGDYYSNQNKYLIAQEQYLAALKTYQAIHDTGGQMFAYASIGILNRNLADYRTSLSYFLKGMNLGQGAQAYNLRGLLLMNTGLAYQLMGIPDSALYCYYNSLYLFHKAGNRRQELRVQNSIGSVYLDGNRYEAGLIYFNNLLPEVDSSDREMTGIIYTRIGHIYDKRKEYRISQQYNRKALNIRQIDRGSVMMNSSLINLSGDYYNLDKPDSAKLFMDSGLALAYKYGRKNLLSNGYRHLYSYYLRLGNLKKALDWYAKYSSVNDDIKLEQNRNNIAIVEANQRLQKLQYEEKVNKKQHAIQSLNLKYQIFLDIFLKGLLSIAGISVLIYVFFLFYFRRIRRKMQVLHDQLSEEIREREATESQTRDRETQYRFLTENTIDFITHWDENGRRIYASPACLNVYGYDRDEIMQKTSLDLTEPGYHEFTEARVREMIETRSSRQFAYKSRKKDGTVFWVESILNPLFDPISGDFKGMVGVTRDIQERKTKELEIMEGTKQKENLLKEIHHRVKNNFAILVSLINMQMAQTKNEELLQSLTNLQLRIRTMALVHEMLYRSGDFEKISFPGYLRSLASVIAGTYNRRDVELTIEADEVVMDIEASIPLGLIVNEILSNAYKHAFPGERGGKIELRFTMDSDNGLNTLIIKDDGIGMPVVDNLDHYKTLGMKVVQILCHQIEGTLEVANEPGASFTITFQASSR